MEATAEKIAIARQLQATINAMQGLGKLSDGLAKTDLAPFNAAFPEQVFPIGAIHEFVSYDPAHAASTTGFITAIAGKLMKSGGLCLWIGNEKQVFASGLKPFGIEPDRIVFIHTSKPKEALWIIEEALKCEALSMVIGELKELNFTDSRRLQLAVERSGITGFIHRYQPFRENNVACTTRWKITPIASSTDDGLPGIGYSCWDVQLLKVKNGRPGSWQISWINGQFMPTTEKDLSIPLLQERHAG